MHSNNLTVLNSIFFMSWDQVFPGTQYNAEHHDKSRLYSSNTAINYFISSCFFQKLSEEGAVRILSSKNDIRTYVTTNIFESCQHKTMDGGSLKINNGYIVQTKNSYLYSKAKESGSAYISSSSQKFDILNTANETIVFGCGSTESDNDMTVVGHSNGLVIMNQCNISKNKATYSVGPNIHNICNDSYVTCLHLIENTVAGPTCVTLQHGTYIIEGIPRYVFNTSVFMNNKAESGGSLITTYSNLFMDSCIIGQNQVQYLLDLEKNSISVSVQNTKTDNTNKKGPAANMANIQTTSNVKIDQCSNNFNITIPDEPTISLTVSTTANDDSRRGGTSEPGKLNGLSISLTVVGVLICLALIGVVVFIMLKKFKPKVAADEDARVHSDPSKEITEYELNEQGIPDTDLNSALLTTTKKPDEYFDQSDSDAFDTEK